MKILVLNYEFPPLGGGASPVSKEIAVQLQRMGHRVTVVTMGFEGLPAYEEIEGVRVYRLKCWRSKKSSCMPWEQYTYLVAIRKFMKKHLVENYYDVCHTHFIIPTGEAAQWLNKYYHIPYIITAHGSDVEGYNQKKYMKIMHKILKPSWKSIVRNSNGVVAPSLYLLGLMKKEMQNGDYTLIPNGLDVKKYKTLYSEDFQKEHRILLMGRMQKSKNFQTILRAISKIDLQDWKLDILGDGPYREELERLSKELGISDRVNFRGWIDNSSQEQFMYLKKASIYITASHFENCPMAVLETIAAGCYPLLSDIPGHRQFIKDNKYFFEMDSEDELAEKVENLIKTNWNDNREFTNIWDYDWKNIMCKYESLLEMVARR